MACSDNSTKPLALYKSDGKKLGNVSSTTTSSRWKATMHVLYADSEVMRERLGGWCWNAILEMNGEHFANFSR